MVQANYSTLAPRRQLTSAPYAIFSGTAGTVTNGAIASPQLANGAVSTSQLASNAVDSSKIASGQVVKSLNSLKDNVTLAPGPNITLNTVGNSVQISAPNTGGWGLTGNSGTTPGTHFLGTTDGQPLELRANGVGIGTSSPDAPLTVGSSSVRGIINIYGGASTLATLSLVDQRPGGHFYTFYAGSSGAGNLDLVDQNTVSTVLTVRSNGNVGIGTTAPTQKLDVNGGIRATGASTASSGAGVEIDYSVVGPRIFGYDRDSSSFLDFGIGDFTQEKGVVVKANGNVGIGMNNPSSKLHVNGTVRAESAAGAIAAIGDYLTIPAQDTHASIYGKGDANGSFAAYFDGFAGARHLAINPNPESGSADAGTPLYVHRLGDGTLVNFNNLLGSITISGSSVSYNAFTGSHYARADEEIERGSLVCLTGANDCLAGQPGSEIIYGIAPSDDANNPRCLGAYLSLQEPSKPYSHTNPHLVMAVGNGDMWVADGSNEDIQPGDYLISSDVAGCAMKDDPDKFPVGYICARAAEKVNWSEVKPDEKGVKRRKISVLFETFVRDSRGAQLASMVKAQQAELQSLRAELKSLRTFQERLARLEVIADKQDDLLALQKGSKHE